MAAAARAYSSARLAPSRTQSRLLQGSLQGADIREYETVSARRLDAHRNRTSSSQRLLASPLVQNFQAYRACWLRPGSALTSPCWLRPGNRAARRDRPARPPKAGCVSLGWYLARGRMGPPGRREISLPARRSVPGGSVPSKYVPARSVPVLAVTSQTRLGPPPRPSSCARSPRTPLRDHHALHRA